MLIFTVVVGAEDPSDPAIIKGQYAMAQIIRDAGRSSAIDCMQAGYLAFVKVLREAGVKIDDAEKDLLRQKERLVKKYLLEIHLDVVNILRDAGVKFDAKPGTLIKMASEHFEIVKDMGRQVLHTDPNDDTLSKIRDVHFEIARPLHMIFTLSIRETGINFERSRLLIKMALAKGYLEFVKVLRDVGAITNETLSKMASAEGSLEIVKVLSEANAKVNAESEKSIKMAEDKRYSEAVKILSEAGIKVEDIEFKKLTLTYEIAMDSLKSAGVKVDTNNGLLKMALAKSHFYVVKALRDEDVKMDGDRETLIKIFLDKESEIVEILSEEYVNVEAGSEQLMSMALVKIHLQFVEFLKEVGVKADAESDTLIKMTLSHFKMLEAIRRADIKVVQENETLIAMAFAKGQLEVVKILKDAGIKVDAESDTLIKMAVAHFEILKAHRDASIRGGAESVTGQMTFAKEVILETKNILKGAGVKVDLVDHLSEGDTLIQIISAHMDVLNVLSKAGFDATTLDTLIRMVAHKRHFDMMQILSEASANTNKKCNAIF